MTASDRIEELKKRYDENPRRFFAPLANEYRKAGDLEQAIALCQTHLAEQPSNMNGHVVYGQALYESGRYDEAKGTFETALMLDPENLIALRHLGDIACANGANHEARELYERVLYADPRNDAVRALLTHLAAEEAKGPTGAPPGSIEPATVTATPEALAASRAVTPLSRTPVSDPTPIVPIEAVTTVRAPAVSLFVPADPVVPGAHAADELDAVFADAEEIHFATPADALPAVPLWPAAQSSDESFAMQSDLVMDPFAEPEAAPEPPATPRVVEVAEAPAPSRPEIDDEPAYDAKPEPPAEPFVTETMAELYLQQGFTAEALDVYRKLSAAAPADKRLAERVRRLELGDRTPVEPDWAPVRDTVAEIEIPVRSDEARPDSLALLDFEVDTVALESAQRDAKAEPVVAATIESVPDPVPDTVPARAPSARSYFAALAIRRAVQTSRVSRPTPLDTAPQVPGPVAAAGAPPASAAESLNELFAGGTISTEDESLALTIAQVAGAAEMGGAAVRGKPTEAAATELSLDSVFREPESRATTPVSRQSQTLRFDQFFAATGEEPAAQDAPAPSGEPGSPAELQQFQSWLTRLKQP